MEPISYSKYDYFELSQADVYQIHQKYPGLFSIKIDWGTLVHFANLFQIAVVKELSKSDSKGRLEIRKNGTERKISIYVNSALNPSEQILVLGHEIGHYILKKNHFELDTLKSIEWKEKYSQVFASEICVSTYQRAQILAKLAIINNIHEFLNVIREFEIKISISIFLKLMLRYARNIAFQFDSNKSEHFLITARLVKKPNSSLPAKLRIISSFYNFNKFFIPEYKRLEEFFVENGWFCELEIGKVRQIDTMIEIDIKNQISNKDTKYSKKKFKVKCSFMSLNKRKDDLTSTILIYVELV